ncbi:MAG TPA: ADP-ribosylglycohydrolase family protein [Cyclobacteriaceae bacterium]|nr:ADP-ribosylglycohydrolase family protein [Cyclobacteriaceae bacterium]
MHTGKILLKYTFIFTLVLQGACSSDKKQNENDPQAQSMTLSKEALRNKIKGAWAAQTIGVTFGAPIEFQYNSTMVQDNQKIEWTDSTLSSAFRNKPGLYDDIYMDLTFMQVIQDNGLDATPSQYADAIGKSSYKLWFANQTARNNIQNGLQPPQSGHWLNNPCADDIDFQIEADFAGLMSPGMVNSAIQICDRVGHIMNYGDGYYGGVFIASLYSEALVVNDAAEMEKIIIKALEPIPSQSKFVQCIQDVIKWHHEKPDDWKYTWYRTNEKWSTDTGSPWGIFKPFNIDAKINAAWVVLGLLYGNGDFTRTFEITTRCGDDADCNPASAGGVLAAIVGYDKIPEFWKQGLDKVSDIPFMGTTISLNQAYVMSYEHAEKMIVKNGGKVADTEITIQKQKASIIPLEVSFEGHYPTQQILPVITKNEISFEFDGIGFALVSPPNIKDYGDKTYVFETEVYIDGQLTEKVKLPTAENKRRFTPFWKYQLPKGKHKVVVRILNPVAYAEPEIKYAIVFDDKPVEFKF